MDEEEFQISGAPGLCFHCGVVTVLRIRTEYTYAITPEDYTGTKDIERIKWSLLQCPECFKPTLLQVDQVSQRVETHLWKTKVIDMQALYPAEIKIPSSIPEPIRKLYAEAILVKLLSPSSCAVLVRRTLEAVCRHEHATGRTLADKLRNLANSGKVPQTLVDVAFHLKQLGNLGAHFDVDDGVTTEDMPIILDFAGLFLEYLYEAPAKIQEVRDRLNNPRRNIAPTSNEQNTSN